VHNLRKAIHKLVEVKKFDEKSWDFVIGKLVCEYQNEYTLEQISQVLKDRVA
jgi:hypothetical protein